MVIKVYTSGISGNKEVKKRQQRIMMILESKNIDYEAIDITEPGRETDKQFMQDNAKAKDSKHPLPPQIFNEEDYCGDYDGFDLANENDELEIFLKLPLPPAPAVIQPPPVVNGREHSTEKESSEPPQLERNEELINSMVPNSLEVEQTMEQTTVENDNDDALGEEKDETESSINEQMEVNEQNGEENEEEGEEDDDGDGDE